MGEVIQFRRLPSAINQSAPGLLVRVLRDADGWLVVARQHSWLFRNRREAQAEAHNIANGFGVGILVQMGGRS